MLHFCWVVTFPSPLLPILFLFLLIYDIFIYFFPWRMVWTLAHRDDIKIATFVSALLELCHGGTL
jgi:hypothetical protein